MLILLPPSEGKTAPARGAQLRLETLAFPELTEPRTQVLESLTALCSNGREGAAETLGLGRTQADQVERNAGLTTAPAARADRVYSGVLYETLSMATLDARARGRASRWVAVVSSLFGLVRPADRIPAYRLAGNVTLPGLGGVAAHWSRHLAPAAEAAAGRGVVVDLRSSTYAAFWRPSAEVARQVVTVRVLHEQNGVRKVVSHFNKATKGRLVRSLLVDGGTPATPEAFGEQLRDLGWTVEPGARGQLDVVVSEL